MPILTNKEFHEKCIDFINKSKMSKTMFGIKANNDSRFFYDLERGKKFGEEIKIRILSFMKAYEERGKVKANDFYKQKVDEGREERGNG